MPAATVIVEPPRIDGSASGKTRPPSCRTRGRGLATIATMLDREPPTLSQVAAAHGLSALTLIRSLHVGVVAITLAAPSVVYSATQSGGIMAFVQSGIDSAVGEHLGTGQAIPRWPVLRPSDILSVDPAEKYAPTIDIRWTKASSAESAWIVVIEPG